MKNKTKKIQNNFKFNLIKLIKCMVNKKYNWMCVIQIILFLLHLVNPSYNLGGVNIIIITQNYM